MNIEYIICTDCQGQSVHEETFHSLYGKISPDDEHQLGVCHQCVEDSVVKMNTLTEDYHNMESL